MEKLLRSTMGAGAGVEVDSVCGSGFCACSRRGEVWMITGPSARGDSLFGCMDGASEAVESCSCSGGDNDGVDDEFWLLSLLPTLAGMPLMLSA